jgi:hypothetical protein
MAESFRESERGEEMAPELAGLYSLIRLPLKPLASRFGLAVEGSLEDVPYRDMLEFGV